MHLLQYPGCARASAGHPVQVLAGICVAAPYRDLQNVPAALERYNFIATIRSNDPAAAFRAIFL